MNSLLEDTDPSDEYITRVHRKKVEETVRPISDTRPKTTVRLTISADDLADCDVFSKSDPFCVVYEKSQGRKNTTDGKVTSSTWKDKNWVERGRTEQIKNNLNPQFTKSIVLPYYFEEMQVLRFEIYDQDTKNPSDFDQHDFIGRFECALAEIVSCSSLKAHLGKSEGLGKIWKNGDKKAKPGSITIRAEEDERASKLIFDVRGEKLDKKDFFGKSDPYLTFSRKFDDGGQHVVHRTEIKPKTLDPRWNTVSINLQSLCGKEGDRPIKIDCFDHDKWKSDNHKANGCRREGKFSRDDVIGVAKTTLDHILTGANGEECQIELIHNEKKRKKPNKYKNSGVLKISNARIVVEPTFLDFISGGTQLDFAVAIDFTASNGAVTHPRSLHHMFSDRPNQYEIALRACLTICQHYNSSKKFEAYGFGAKLSPSSPVSAVFDLDLKNKTSTVYGVQGVMRAYRDALHEVQLYGPTNFAPIIDRVAGSAANKMMNSARYQILLIITDGIISDMQKTISSIINASGLPLSIIIIGVGNEDFEKMQELDSDDKLLQQDSRIAQRDIVQFVTMRQFLNDKKGAYLDPELVMQNLARDVLYEVPYQLTSYMKARGFQARPADDPWARDSPPPGFDIEQDKFPGRQEQSVPSSSPYPIAPQPTQQPPIGFNVYQNAPPYPSAYQTPASYTQQPATNTNYAPSAPPVDTPDVVPRYQY